MPAIQTTRLYQLLHVKSRTIGVWHCGQGRKMKVLAVVVPTKATTDQEIHAIRTTRLYQLLHVESRAIGVRQCGQGQTVKVLALVIPWQKENPEFLGENSASLESRS